MKISVTKQPSGEWIAIDADTYDCDCDELGFFTTSATGWGKTAYEAIDDLLAEIAERASAA